MFSLAYPLVDTTEIDGVTYPLDLSFDNVLRLIDMLGDKELSDVVQVETGLVMLLGEEIECEIDRKANIFYSLYEKVILGEAKVEQAVDIKGNPMPTVSNDDETVYSLIEDAEYIYASFMQDYGMDLFEYQGKLHWNKFQALLSGLRDDTKFKKVMEIRQMEVPTGKGSEKQRKAVLDAKKVYALKGQSIDEDDPS
ncbi:MAG: bacteriophage Gp15 family protein [Psychrobacillus psychrodurans]